MRILFCRLLPRPPEWLIPQFIDINTCIFANVNSEDTLATVTLTAYDDNGNTVATETINLSPHEKVVNHAERIFTQDISSATYIRYSSDKEVVGFQLNGSSDNMMLDTLLGM